MFGIPLPTWELSWQNAWIVYCWGAVLNSLVMALLWINESIRVFRSESKNAANHKVIRGRWDRLRESAIRICLVLCWPAADFVLAVILLLLMLVEWDYIMADIKRKVWWLLSLPRRLITQTCVSFEASNIGIALVSIALLLLSATRFAAAFNWPGRLCDFGKMLRPEDTYVIVAGLVMILWQLFLVRKVKRAIENEAAERKKLEGELAGVKKKLEESRRRKEPPRYQRWND